MSNDERVAGCSPAAPLRPIENLANRPKVLLHEHLDGGLRPGTLLDLCAARGLGMPFASEHDLLAWLRRDGAHGSLENYLRAFNLTVAAMASTEACERVAFEAAEDARADGCVIAEFRMAPLLLEAHGLRAEAAIEAMLAGLRQSMLASGLIVCAMRHEPAEASMRAARLAARYRDQGVIGFDLAGAERGHPPLQHAQAFWIARDAALGLTCHAGEADGGERVLEAAALGATRIGHGVRIMSGSTQELAERVHRARDLGLHFEVCPTSNVQTGAVPSLREHPIGRMHAAGLSLSCSTDNRLMSGVTLTSELQAVLDARLVDAPTLAAMTIDGARASFLAAEVKARAEQQIRAGWADVLG